MENIRQVLAENLRFYRRTLGLSQSSLAKKANSGTNYIGMIEIGKRFPSPEMIERLAAVLGIDSTRLFSKQASQLETPDSLKITILSEVEGLVGRFIRGQIENLSTGSDQESPPGKDKTVSPLKKRGRRLKPKTKP